MSKPRIGIVIGSTRQGRFAEKPAQWVAELARVRGDLDIEIVDLRDYPLPFFEEAASLARAPATNEIALRWQAKIGSLDGFIFTVAEYNHAPTAVLKNAIDYAYSEWQRKPAAFVGYGAAGAARAVVQLRSNLSVMQMVPVSTAVQILMPDFMSLMQGKATLGEIPHLEESAKAMLDQFAWWAKTLTTARGADAAKALAA